MWGLITGSIAGLIDAALILVAYILYPFVVAIFGFFYIFYGTSLYLWANRDCSHAPRSNESPCQSLCRKRHDLERMAHPVWRLRCPTERGSDGTSWSNAEPEQFSRRSWESRGFVPDWGRQHYLLPGDRGHTIYRQEDRQR